MRQFSTSEPREQKDPAVLRRNAQSSFVSWCDYTMSLGVSGNARIHVLKFYEDAFVNRCHGFFCIDIFNLFRDANSVLVMAGERQG